MFPYVCTETIFLFVDVRYRLQLVVFPRSGIHAVLGGFALLNVLGLIVS